MQLSRNQKIGVVAVSLLVSFAAGRYTVTETIKTKTETIETEKKKEDTVIVKKRDKNVKIVVTETDRPDGTKIITTVTTDLTKSSVDTNTKLSDTGSKTSDSSSSTVKGESKVSLSALGGVDMTNGHLLYGLSVIRPVLGPITVGAFGLSDGTIGASVGVSF